MKTSDVYYKVYATSEIPCGIFTYSYRDFDNVIQVSSLAINFNDGHEYNIERMERYQAKYGKYFMFWNNSDEAEKFWQENPIRFKYEYKGK
jgi:hypothetical protein